MDVKRVSRYITTAGLVAALTLGGCTAATTEEAAATGSTIASFTSSDATSVASYDASALEATPLDTSDMFSDRDMEGTWDAETATTIVLSDAGCEVSGDGVSVDGSVLTITAEGTYVVSGTLSDGQIIVDVSSSEKVQIVFDGASITSSSSAALYVRQADKVFVTLASSIHIRTTLLSRAHIAR